MAILLAAWYSGTYHSCCCRPSTFSAAELVFSADQVFHDCMMLLRYWLHDDADWFCCTFRVRFDNVDLALSTLHLAHTTAAYPGLDWLTLNQQSYDVGEDNADVEMRMMIKTVLVVMEVMMMTASVSPRTKWPYWVSIPFSIHSDSELQNFWF